MGQKSGPVKEPAEQVVKEVRCATRRQFSAEEKIRIVLSGLRGGTAIAQQLSCAGVDLHRRHDPREPAARVRQSRVDDPQRGGEPSRPRASSHA